jgi:hypothetical protein
MNRFIYKITDYTESWENGECIKSVNNISFNEISQVISLAWYYWENSDVIETINLDNLQNAIDFIERVDKVEKCEVIVYEAFSPEYDLTTIYEDIIDSNGQCIKMEVKGFYHGKPDESATQTFYGKTKWGLYDN